MTALRKLASLGLLTSALVAPALASAQEPERNVAVQDRPRPDYDPLGIRAGSFFFFPSFTVQGVYDDNVFAVSEDEDDDFGLVLSPELLISSNFSRHALNFRAGADFGLWEEFDDNNYEDAHAETNGRLDITRADQVTAGLGIYRSHEERSSPDDVGTEEPTIFYRGVGQLGYRHTFNRIYTQFGAQAQRLDFEDNNDINEDDRDRMVYDTTARVGYQISPRFGAFLQGGYQVTKYDTTGDDGLKRDSKGFDVRIGTDIDITGLVFGELGVGYTRRSPDSSDLDSFDGVGGGGKITWNITPLTTLIFDAAGQIDETTVKVDGEPASANFQKSIGLDVTHELLRNVLLNGNVAFVRDDFEGTSRTDNSYFAGAGVSYLINRNFSLDATYRFATRDSDVQTEDYTSNIVRLGITARL
ncbi:outer membrane beta-barrel protein [Geminicoccaceae bacterium 1502E]|nr:outer membrane beta-barrel protein [Geminicoccaceae bacterium 1502E]